MIIYYIKNKLNNKMYIGQTIYALKKRLQRHLSKARNGETFKLYQAIRKYGWENFEYGIICECVSVDELNRKETEYIEKYDTYKNGYNMTLGGGSNVMFIDEYKQKHDAKMRTIEVRKKISESMKKLRKEKGFSKETRKKLSEKLKGNKNYLNEEFPKHMPVKCIIDNKILHFSNRKDAIEWWRDNGNHHGINRRYKDIAKCIKEGIEMFGTVWMLDKENK